MNLILENILEEYLKLPYLNFQNKEVFNYIQDQIKYNQYNKVLVEQTHKSKLETNETKLETNSSKSITRIVPKKITRCGAIIFSEDFKKVLLVKNKTVKKWGFPKGGMKINESIFCCAQREVFEETGLNLTINGQILDHIHIDNCIYFLVHLKEKIKFKIHDTEEIEKIKFISIDCLCKLYSNIHLKLFNSHFIG